MALGGSLRSGWGLLLPGIALGKAGDLGLALGWCNVGLASGERGVAGLAGEVRASSGVPRSPDEAC